MQFSGIEKVNFQFWGMKTPSTKAHRVKSEQQKI